MPPFNPDPIGRPTFRKQFPLRPEDFQEIARDSREGLRSSASSEEVDLGAGMGFQRAGDVLPAGFYARLTARPIITDPTNLYYNFIEVQDDGTGDGWVAADSALRGNYNGYPISGNPFIPVPGPPINLNGSSPGDSTFYMVTTIWQNLTDGNDYQSGESLEWAAAGLDVLTWTAPVNWPGWQVAGYQIWRGLSSGGYNILAGAVGPTTTTFTDTGDGVEETPVPGGQTGPIVWMIPLSALNYYKFIDTYPLSAVIGSLSSGTPNLAGYYDSNWVYWNPLADSWPTVIPIWIKDANS